MNTKQLLKETQAELIAVQSIIEVKIKESHLLKSKITAYQRQIEIDERSIEDIVSAHAIVRFLERTLGLDIENFKKELIADHEANIRKLQTCKITTANGVLVVKDGVVVTIL